MKTFCGISIKTILVSADLAKAHISAYTKKDGTFVAAHEDKRDSVTSAAASVPANAIPVKRSFVVQKVGKKRALIVQHLLSAMGHGVFAKSFSDGFIVLRPRAMLVMFRQQRFAKL